MEKINTDNIRWRTWTLANRQRFGFEFHLRSSPSAFSGHGCSVDQVITSLLATLCWRGSTRSKRLSTVGILGFQFRLYHVDVPLSFLRRISIASVYTILSIFGWSDLLQILRRPAALYPGFLQSTTKVLAVAHLDQMARNAAIFLEWMT